MINLIENRGLLRKLRSLAKKIPGVWALYWVYWGLRKKWEASGNYGQNIEVVNFGSFPAPTLANPQSQLCTADQFDVPEYVKWCKLLKSPPRYSRKQWEFVYILQVLELAGCLVSGKRGLGFGCGQEPMPGVFAHKGCNVVATDLDFDRARKQGWASTSQHSSKIEDLYKAAKDIVNEQNFKNQVTFEVVDMNNVPDKFAGQFDFVWSACALEHLGSLQHGIDFIHRSLSCLKPGGVAVHTTEFNLSSTEETLETEACSLYRQRDIKSLADQLEKRGFSVAPLNFHTGERSVDRFVDLPPYRFSPHLKLRLEQYVTTSIGLTIAKR